MRRLGDEEIRVFLTAGTRTGKLGITRLDGRPMVVPGWFAVDDDGTLLFTTWHDTIKGKALRRDGRVSLCVDEEQPPHAYVRVDGVAALTDDPRLRRWATRIGARYMGVERPRSSAPQRRAGRAARAHHADADRRARPTSPADGPPRRCAVRARSPSGGIARDRVPAADRRACSVCAVPPSSPPSSATAVSGLSASPAAAADPLAACDPALAPGLTWSAPSFLAWGREARVGANVADPATGRATRTAPSRSAWTPAAPDRADPSTAISSSSLGRRPGARRQRRARPGRWWTRPAR